MGLTREVGDTLLIRGYLSKELKEVREQPRETWATEMGGCCVSGGGTGQCRVRVGERVCMGRIQRGGPCVWSEGETWG